MFYQTNQLYMGGREVTRGVGRPDVKKFAPRNGRTRASRQRGANRAREKPAGPRRGRGICVKILLPLTKAQGLAGSGEQTGRPGRRSPVPPTKFPVRGSRPETENKGLAGRRARTRPPVGPAFSKLPEPARSLPWPVGPPSGRLSVLFPFRRPPALRLSLQQINCIVSQFIQRNFYK